MTTAVQQRPWLILSASQNLKGRRADLTTARRTHECCQCPRPIAKGEDYYSIIIPGAGLASLKFPLRAHVDCLHSVEMPKADGADALCPHCGSADTEAWPDLVAAPEFNQEMRHKVQATWECLECGRRFSAK